MKVLLLRAANSVDGLPGDQHGHHGRFACAGGKFEREAKDFGIRLLVGALEMVQKFTAASALFGATSVSQIAVSTASIWQKKGDP